MNAADKVTVHHSPAEAKEISQALIDIENERGAPIDALSFMFGVRFAEQRIGIYIEEESK
ncbi:MAG: hypothetical protein LLG15_02140 [Betaproteobacteria bacterium]|nr:hypothetical protein [Betaproteobacteria bacterium]